MYMKSGIRYAVTRAISIAAGCLMIAMTSAGLAQQSTVRLWNGLAPGTEGRKDEEERVNGDVFRVYQPDLEVFLPKEKNKSCPAVVILPGGGYTHLAYIKEGVRIARWLNTNGVAAFILKYRLNPDEALQDAQRALSLVRAQAAQFGINPDEIGILGFSAGGQVAANLATHYTKSSMADLIDSISCKPDFLVLIYPALNWLHRSFDNDVPDPGDTSFVPFYKLVDKNTPSTFIVHATDDGTVPVKESIDFYTALHKAGVPCELHIYEKGGHGFGLERDRGAVSGWGELCVIWMKVNGILTAK